MLIGRNDDLALLSKIQKEDKASLIVVYGRRRIGKSFLIHQYLSSFDHFYFEGIEGQSSQYHISTLSEKLLAKLKSNPYPNKQFNKWEDILDLITFYIKSRNKKKTIIFLDEYQWISAGRSKLTSLLKEYWDNQWKKENVQLILCGSISSFMIKKVVKSKALYGRINAELNIRQLPPNEAKLFFKKGKSDFEKLKYLLIFGGTPKYLEDIKSTISFEKNLANFFFNKYSTYINEYEKIFYSQFKEHQIYEKIIRLLSDGPSTLDKIATSISFQSGGGLKSYLENLQKAEFVSSYFSNPEKLKSKILTYKLIDPFLRFYLMFVFPNRKLINNSKDSLGLLKRITKNKLNIFLGFALENFCQLFALDLAASMGFEDEVLSYGPLWSKKDDPFQIDLIYFRENKNITICEIKYSEDLISPLVIPEVENRLSKLRKIYPEYSFDKALITTVGVTKALKESKYFDYVIDAKGILR